MGVGKHGAVHRDWIFLFAHSNIKYKRNIPQKYILKQFEEDSHLTASHQQLNKSIFMVMLSVRLPTLSVVELKWFSIGH